MPVDTYDTREMLGIVEITKPPSTFFLNKYFSTRPPHLSKSRKIDFDAIEALRRVSPFVAPRVKGRVVQRKGYTTKTFEPAYVKDVRIINPDDTTFKLPGQPIGAPADPALALAALTSDAVRDQQEMLARRKELMCVEILRTGAVSISGEDYDPVVVSYGRHADLSSAIVTPFSEVDAALDPLKEVKAKALISKRLGHIAPRDLFMAAVVFDDIMLHPMVRAKLDNRNVTGNSVTTAINGLAGAQFQGTYDGFNFWTFDDWYLDENEVEQRMMPEDELIGVGDVGGIMTFGKIQDLKAGDGAMEFFSKMWEDEDPSGLHILAQSAPLPVATRPNGCFRLTGVRSEESS